MKRKPKTLAQLRDELARQILEIALQDENPQYKLDAFKATQERGRPQTQAAAEEPMDGMSIFAARVRKASETGADGADPEPPETDC